MKPRLLNPSRRLRYCVAAMAILTCISVARAAEPEAMPDPNRGIYAIWARPEQLKGLDFVTGGQIHLQWRDLQTGPDTYDFAKLDEALKAMSEAGTTATVQVNGNRKPDFLYSSVPLVSEKLSTQISDPQGSLMYWHPNHRDAYLAFITAFGEHMKRSPHADVVLGVRLNFNALGTEHLHVPAEYHDAASWKTPVGVTPGADWSADVMKDYKHRVIDAFVRAFRPHARVFVRNNVVLEEPLDPDLVRRFETGDLALFHTSSEAQPRSDGTARRYEGFIRWARSGKTVAYAESWADAWGRHGGKRDERWCGPSQWNYWRVLVDLHCGVSFIAVYGADLAAAQTDPEFADAFRFGAKYAGLHATPSKAPGAWAALREGEFMKGDYDYLMERLDDPAEAVRLAGPSDQRFGAWAIRVPADGRMRFRVDRRFLKARAGQSLLLRVIYLDEGRGRFDVAAGQRRRTVTLTNSGRWRRAEWTVSPSDLAIESDHHIEIRTGDAPVVFHMVELTEDDGPADLRR